MDFIAEIAEKAKEIVSHIPTPFDDSDEDEGTASNAPTQSTVNSNSHFPLNPITVVDNSATHRQMPSEISAPASTPAAITSALPPPQLSTLKEDMANHSLPSLTLPENSHRHDLPSGRPQLGSRRKFSADARITVRNSPNSPQILSAAANSPQSSVISSNSQDSRSNSLAHPRHDHPCFEHYSELAKSKQEEADVEKMSRMLSSDLKNSIHDAASKRLFRHRHAVVIVTTGNKTIVKSDSLKHCVSVVNIDGDYDD